MKYSTWVEENDVELSSKQNYLERPFWESNIWAETWGRKDWQEGTRSKLAHSWAIRIRGQRKECRCPEEKCAIPLKGWCGTATMKGRVEADEVRKVWSQGLAEVYSTPISERGEESHKEDTELWVGTGLWRLRLAVTGSYLPFKFQFSNYPKGCKSR